MDLEKKTEEFYNKLKIQLSNDTLWPSNYLYKFIIPTDGKKIEQIAEAFKNHEAIISTKESSKGNFTSVSVHVKMKNPDAVIEKYQEVSYIEGIISL